MKGIHMLTLSIAEAKPETGEFNINCLHIALTLKGKLLSFEKRKSEIFDSEGNAVWDLGKITVVEDVQLNQYEKRNQIYNTVGSVKLLDRKEVTKDQLKKALEANLVEYSTFKEDSQMVYAIVKPQKVIDIDKDTSKDSPKQRMRLDFGGKYRDVVLLNKDYRWVNYWNRIPDDIIYTRQDMYEKMFNSSDKELYLIVRKYYFSGQEKPKRWITGMHWL